MFVRVGKLMTGFYNKNLSPPTLRDVTRLMAEAPILIRNRKAQ
jgi:hypothetical protein